MIVSIDIPDGVHVPSRTPGEPFLIPTTFRFGETGDVEARVQIEAASPRADAGSPRHRVQSKM